MINNNPEEIKAIKELIELKINHPRIDAFWELVDQKFTQDDWALFLPTDPKMALKGEYRGNCNRTACQQPGAVYFNKSTRSHYCETCAERINAMNRTESMELFGTELCVLVEEGKDT